MSGYASRRQPWLRQAPLAGIVYFLVGRLFALPADKVWAWCLAAWVISAAVYAAHMRCEYWRMGNPLRSTALHLSTVVAVGLALALASSGRIVAKIAGGYCA